MKRFILRLTVALVAFSFGLVIERVSTQQVQTPRTVWKLEPVAPTFVPTCPESTPVPLGNPTPDQHAVLYYNPFLFDPRGTYFPMSRMPKEFAEFDLFELSTEESDGVVWGSGIVQTRSNDMYDFQNTTFLLITEHRLFFVSIPRFDAHFEYRFDGEFLGNPGWLIDTGKAAVRGKLTKWEGGRKVAERELSFDVKYLGC